MAGLEPTPAPQQQWAEAIAWKSVHYLDQRLNTGWPHSYHCEPVTQHNTSLQLQGLRHICCDLGVTLVCVYFADIEQVS